MRLCDYVSRDLIFIINDATEKPIFLRKVVGLVRDRLPEVDAEDLFYHLMAREEQVTTGIGRGVAIPHTTVAGLERTRCVLVQIPAGVDFQALDASPVHVLFLLLSPPGATGTHIRLLARIARLADKETFVWRLAKAQDEQELLRLVNEEDCQHV